jgi:K(+)-stimulated pyrophosphate-energized sodium pump
MSVQHSTNETTQSEENKVYFGGSTMILIYLFLLILAAAAAWYLLGTTISTTSEHAIESTTGSTVKEQATETTVTGKTDSLGNFVYPLGKMLTINLPNNGGKLEVGELSTENKLYQFLSDTSAKIDTVKGNWFELTNTTFKTGGTQIDTASMGQLTNIAAIIKSFSKASFKIGGYTDNSGDTAKNIALSQKRADAVFAALKKLTVAPVSLTGAKGYGPQYPIGDNATSAGKAQNRRVAINVKAK